MWTVTRCAPPAARLGKMSRTRARPSLLLFSEGSPIRGHDNARRGTVVCGLTGFLQFGGGAAESLRRDVEAMAATLTHRGPDDRGTWVDAAAGIALGFRRLAILDLSPMGHQPMESASSRFLVA